VYNSEKLFTWCELPRGHVGSSIWILAYCIQAGVLHVYWHHAYLDNDTLYLQRTVAPTFDNGLLYSVFIGTNILSEFRYDIIRKHYSHLCRSCVSCVGNLGSGRSLIKAKIDALSITWHAFYVNKAMKLHGWCKLREQCISTIKLRSEQYIHTYTLVCRIYWHTVYMLICCINDERQAYRVYQRTACMLTDTLLRRM
jgi:hypothetical protein